MANPQTTHVVEIEQGIGEPAFIPLSFGTEMAPISVGRKGMWRIESARVLDVHVFVYFDGTSLFLQSADESNAAMVDGYRVGKSWTELHAPCRIEIGAARLNFRSLIATDNDATQARPIPVPSQGPVDMPVPPPRTNGPATGRPFAPGAFSSATPEDESTRFAPAGGPRAPAPRPAAGRPAAQDAPDIGPDSDATRVETPIRPPARPPTGQIQVPQMAAQMAPPGMAPMMAPPGMQMQQGQMQQGPMPQGPMTGQMMAAQGQMQVPFSRPPTGPVPAMPVMAMPNGQQMQMQMQAQMPMGQMPMGQMPPSYAPAPNGMGYPTTASGGYAAPMPQQYGGMPGQMPPPGYPQQPQQMNGAGLNSPTVASGGQPDGLKEAIANFKNASPPKKATVILVPFVFMSIMYLFFFDDQTPTPVPTRPTPSASTSAPVANNGANPNGGVVPTNPNGGVIPANPNGGVAPTNPNGVVVPTNPNGGVVPTNPNGGVVPANPNPNGGVPPGSSAQPTPPPSSAPTPAGTRTLERQAVDALGAGDIPRAIAIYTQLAAANPGNPAYPEAARILRARLDGGT